MWILRKRVAAFLILGLSPVAASASPACVNAGSNNIVLASTYSIEEGRQGRWLLQSVDSSDRIFLSRCSGRVGDSCYFATNVKPGRYYFQQIVPNGGDSLLYPVSTEALWFTITGMGVDYIGHWDITRQSHRAVKRLEIRYPLSDLDRMVALCEIKGRKLYLNRTNSVANEIVD